MDRWPSADVRLQARDESSRVPGVVPRSASRRWSAVSMTPVCVIPVRRAASRARAWTRSFLILRLTV